MSARWVHKNDRHSGQYVSPKERGVSKKERRRRKNALLQAIDEVDISAEESLKALKEAMNDHIGPEETGTARV